MNRVNFHNDHGHDDSTKISLWLLLLLLLTPVDTVERIRSIALYRQLQIKLLMSSILPGEFAAEEEKERQKER